MSETMSLKRAAFGINALSAWIGLGMSIVIETFGLVQAIYVNGGAPVSQFGHKGDYASGLAGAPERLVDLLSYFTIWSQIVVGVVMTLLYLNPNRDGKWLRVFRLDSILMITVTGVVYNLLLGPKYPPQGLNQISSPIEHTITPLITILVFLMFGPRGWFNKKTVGLAFVLPIIYVIYTLIRGVFIGKYPYDFFDVVSYGYSYVIVFVLGILTASMIVLSLFWFIDSRFKADGAK